MRENLVATPGMSPALRRTPMMRMPKARARPARRWPMRPKPTMARVLPPSSSSRMARSPSMGRQWRRGLVVAGEVDLAGQREDEAHGMLGHGALVDALPAREPDALCLEQGTVVLVGSRTQRLHEAQSGARSSR